MVWFCFLPHSFYHAQRTYPERGCDRGACGDVEPCGCATCGRLSNLEQQIAFSYYLGVFAFVALVPYMWKMFELLKPSTVIDILAEKMIKENILSVLEEKSHENDPIQPIVDIIRGSLMKYDYETVRKGMMSIYVHSKPIFKNENIFMVCAEQEFEYILRHNAISYKQLIGAAKKTNL